MKDLFDEVPAKAVAKKSTSPLSALGQGGAGIATAVLTLLFAGLVFLTNIRLGGIFTREFTLELTALLFCCYLMYFSLFDSGFFRGTATEEYKTAYRAFADARRAVEEGNAFPRLYDFCRLCIDEELKRERVSLLTPVGLSIDDFEGYLRAGEVTDRTLSKKQRRALEKAAARRSIRLTPEMLLCNYNGRAGAGGRSPLEEHPGYRRLRYALLSLIPTTVTAVFAVSVVVDVMSDPSASVVLGAILRLLTLLTNGVKGYSDGYRNAERDTVSFNTSRTLLLRRAVTVENARTA